MIINFVIMYIHLCWTRCNRVTYFYSK